MPEPLVLVGGRGFPHIGISRHDRQRRCPRSTRSPDTVCGTATRSPPSRFSIITGVCAESAGPAQHMRAQAELPSYLRGFPDYLRRNHHALQVGMVALRSALDLLEAGLNCSHEDIATCPNYRAHLTELVDGQEPA